MRSVQNYWVGILQPCPTGEFISSCQTRVQKKFKFIWQKKLLQKRMSHHTLNTFIGSDSLWFTASMHSLGFSQCFRQILSNSDFHFLFFSLQFFLYLLYLVLSPGTTQMEPNGSPYYRFKFYSDLKGVVPFHSHFPAASSKGFRLWAQ